LAPAQDGVASEAAGDHQELYDSPGKRQISHAPPIPAMDASTHDGHTPTLPDARTAMTALPPS
jgi:hypothetical protein